MMKSRRGGKKRKEKKTPPWLDKGKESKGKQPNNEKATG